MISEDIRKPPIHSQLHREILRINISHQIKKSTLTHLNAFIFSNLSEEGDGNKNVQSWEKRERLLKNYERRVKIQKSWESWETSPFEVMALTLTFLELLQELRFLMYAPVAPKISNSKRPVLESSRGFEQP